VRQPAVERESCDSAFAKVYRTATDDPHGLTKNVEPVVVSDTVAKTVAEATANVVAMIRKVHEAPAVWDPFSVQQDGVVSKLKAMVGHDEVGVIGTENGKPVIKISKRA